MPEYLFEGTDFGGRTVVGRIAAPTEREAVLRLTTNGLKVKRVTVAFAPGTSEPSAGPAAAVVRTPRANNGELAWFFDRLAHYWRSAVPPATALGHIASSPGDRPFLRRVASELAQAVGHGESLGKALARFPDVFPDGAVGAVAAAETGGYVPEACRLLADQAMWSHQLAKATRSMVRAVAVAGVGVLCSAAMTSGVRKFAADTFGGAGVPESLAGRLAVMAQGFWTAVLGPPGWALAAAAAAYVFFEQWLNATERRHLRHSLGLRIPVFSEQARCENLAQFTWHLAMLSRAGVAPLKAWTMAAAAVPNQAFARRLSAAADGQGRESPFSQIVARSDVVPEEWRDLIRTGETAGSLPDVLMQVSQLARAGLEFRAGSCRWILRTGAAVVLATATVVAAATFFGGFYSAVAQSALGE